MQRATIVGAGGLGGPIASALGAAGVALTIVDPDVVELSNLHRQIQFSSAQLGAAKATTLAASIAGARGVVGRWSAATADELARDADLVVDASDDPATKFAVADWAVAHARPYVIAAALRLTAARRDGRRAGRTDAYRCLFRGRPDRRR